MRYGWVVGADKMLIRYGRGKPMGTIGEFNGTDNDTSWESYFVGAVTTAYIENRK